MNFENLKHGLRGEVIARSDSAYREARERLLWNGLKPDRYPQLIVRAAGVEDVQKTVRFAATSGIQLSVRGGGHNWSGIALQEGIVLDLSALNHVRIDPERRIANIGPAVRNRALAQELATHGLAFPLGHCESVPLSGYLLGGGFGWNSGAWGVACFGIESAEVVMADGEVRQVSETENPDIFWAVRGAGPEFLGVVTAYTLRLQPLPRAITTSVWTYPAEAIGEVDRWIHKTMAVAPRNVEFTLKISNPPPPLAEKADKVVTGIATVFADDQHEARETLARIAVAAPAGALDVQENLPTPFDVLYDIIAQFFPEGHRYSVDTFWAAPGSEGFLARLASETAKAPSPRSFSLGVVLPPASGSNALPDAAFSMVGPIFACSYAIWDDQAGDEENINWLRGTAGQLAPITIGAYVGEADLNRQGRLPRCFSAEAWNRLKALQAKYDPSGIFRTAQSLASIPEPTAAAQLQHLAHDHKPRGHDLQFSP